MDETQISITVKPIYIERLVYWIIILVLAVLLVLAWVKHDNCTTATGTAANDTQTPQTTAPAVTPPTNPAPTPTPAAASCSDGIKNQDETDVDCGGTNCQPCIAGKACMLNGDCVSGQCTAGTCTNKQAVAGLSGNLQLTLNSITTQANPTNNSYHAYKVTSVSYTIKNGLSTDMVGMQAKIFVKDKNNVYCLDQFTVDAATNCANPYSTFTISKVASGGTVTVSTTLDSPTYVQAYVGNTYDPSDSTKDQFNVIMYLYDSSGNQIGGNTVSSSYTFSP